MHNENYTFDPKRFGYYWYFEIQQLLQRDSTENCFYCQNIRDFTSFQFCFGVIFLNVLFFIQKCALFFNLITTMTYRTHSLNSYLIEILSRE